MNIDYTKIITNDLNLLISPERLELIKAEALKERNYIKARYSHEYVKERLFTRAYEVAYTTARYQEKSDTEKALLTANIVFNDDERFAEILRNGNFNLEMLSTYIKLLNYIQKAKAESKKVDEKYTKTAEIFTKRLVARFQRIVGQNEPSIIINKINEIISFKPELLDTQKQHLNTK